MATSGSRGRLRSCWRSGLALKTERTIGRGREGDLRLPWKSAALLKSLTVGSRTFLYHAPTLVTSTGFDSIIQSCYTSITGRLQNARIQSLLLLPLFTRSESIGRARDSSCKIPLLGSACHITRRHDRLRERYRGQSWRGYSQAGRQRGRRGGSRRFCDGSRASRRWQSRWRRLHARQEER